MINCSVSGVSIDGSPISIVELWLVIEYESWKAVRVMYVTSLDDRISPVSFISTFGQLSFSLNPTNFPILPTPLFSGWLTTHSVPHGASRSHMNICSATPCWPSMRTIGLHLFGKLEFGCLFLRKQLYLHARSQCSDTGVGEENSNTLA